MPHATRRTCRFGYVFFTLLALAAAPAALAADELSAPASVPAGAPVRVTWQGESGPRDFVTIVPAGTPEGKYEAYEYARGAEATLTAPEVAGEYEIRFLGGDGPYPTLMRAPLEVTAVSATLTAPASVEAGANFDVSWTGPGHARDFIAIVPAGAPERSYDQYRYADRPTVTLRAPDEPGHYELRYLSAQRYFTLGSTPLEVTGATAKLEAPATVSAGADVEVHWEGPDNPLDFLTIVAAGAEESTFDAYRYTQSGNPLVLRAPDEPGHYEIRYAAGQTYRTLGSQPLEVQATSASLTAPAEAVGGTAIEVQWEGPDHRGDFVGLVRAADAGTKRHVTWAYTERGNPARVLLPVEPGDYVLTYETGNTSRVLASRPLAVTPPAQGPGGLEVFAGSGTTGGFALGPDSAVEIILDASGSMLQRQEGQRRIDIAKAVLTDLATEEIPAGTGFAFRVFGHREAGSCRTDLEIPLQPLDPERTRAVLDGIEALNLAKTPIARSLELVPEDLAGVEGERLVILLTDGEETCGGDPAAAVEALSSSGVAARVNIVGFAIDDADLKSRFRYWAELGGGSYFDSTNADELGKALVSALSVPYAVIDSGGLEVAQGQVGGDAVMLPPGEYTVRAATVPPTEQAVTVKSGETARVTLD